MPRTGSRRRDVAGGTVTLDGGGEDDLRSDINVTPLVDVMLVLLVIFMVVTPLLRMQVPVELPIAKQSDAASPKPDQVTLTAAADGSIRLDGALVQLTSLEDALRAHYANRTDKTVFLEADRGLQYAAVVDLLDHCRAAGIERIGVVTKRPAEGS
jgi:biopolymer transport protein TolR